jgi:CDP-diacylglycerol--glycerol-3-phosphate 3-phosphatidyltransferase
MTLANKITILRIISIPILVIALITHIPHLPIIIFSFSLISDFLDGTVARRFKQKTPLGAFLDPLADKLLLCSAMLTFTLMNILPLWMFVVLFSRDLIISIGWFTVFVLTGSKEVKPRLLGKLTTASQMLAVVCLLLQIPFSILNVLLLAMVLITIISGIDYIIVGSKKLNGSVA